MPTSIIAQHLQTLAAEIGPRPVGTHANQRAADYVYAQLTAAGLAITELGYPCVAWTHHSTTLTINGETFLAAANAFSPACDVSGPLRVFHTPAQLHAADLTGCLALLCGDLTAQPLIPLNLKLYNSERDQQINRQLIERGPLAAITVNLRPGSLEGRIEDADQTCPSATVTPETGLHLLALAGQTAYLRIESERGVGQARTFIAATPRQHAQRVLLMAHYDTKFNTPGASDNATGIAALLALAAALSKTTLPFDLEFIAFGDEEYYANTDLMYHDQFGALQDDILVVINLDGIGQALGINTLTALSASPEREATARAVLNQFPGVVWAEPWIESNHGTFAWRGVPCFALTATGVNAIHHHPADTLEWVCVEKVAEAVALVMVLIDALAVD